ncbi:MAG: mechanosensitive ion channel family protein [Candidatus Nanoarchaeia archaeon]
MITFESIKAFFNFSSEGFIIKLIAAISIVVAGLLIGYIVGKLSRRLLHELELNKVLKEQGFKMPLEELISSFVSYVVYFIALIFALSQLGLRTFVFSIVLGVILVILIAFVILAFKDFIPNVTAGFYVHQQGIVRKGDRIRVRNSEGVVIHTDITETRLKLDNGDIIYIPNSLLLKDEIVKLKSKKGG